MTSRYSSTLATYIEFAAVFLELRFFAPDVLRAYFPSLNAPDRIEAILAEDVDVEPIIAMMVGLPADLPFDETSADSAPGSDDDSTLDRIPKRSRKRMLRAAESAAAKGNDVRAAILHTRVANGSTQRWAHHAREL